MNIEKCPCCGAQRFNKTEDGKTVCAYCDTVISTSQTQHDTNTDNHSEPHIKNGKIYDSNDNPLKINIALFILLFVFTPAIAIIYLIIKILNHSKTTPPKR